MELSLLSSELPEGDDPELAYPPMPQCLFDLEVVNVNQEIYCTIPLGEIADDNMMLSSLSVMRFALKKDVPSFTLAAGLQTSTMPTS